MDIRLRRAYEEPSREDGYRVLVDRVWPRGIRRADLQLDQWLKDVAPSAELRRWFHHDPDRWPEFKRRYIAELATRPEAGNAFQELKQKGRKGRVTLIFGSREARYNNAAALKELLEDSAAEGKEGA